MKGYKVFNPDWTCRGFQYSVGETFEEDVTPSCQILMQKSSKKLQGLI